MTWVMKIAEMPSARSTQNPVDAAPPRPGSGARSEAGCTS